MAAAGDFNSAIEELCDKSQAHEARAGLECIKLLLERVIAASVSSAPVQGSLPATSLSPQAQALVAKCLTSAGFASQAQAGSFLRPAGPADATIQEGLELIEVLLETMEATPAPPTSVPAPEPMAVDMDGEDDDLAEALRLSMLEGGGGGGTNPKRAPEAEAEQESEASKRRERSDAEVAMRLAEEEEKTEDVEFERFRGEDVLITEEAVKEINTFCAESGEPYVDPQFPPTDRSLYVNESDAVTWQCFACHSRSPLPPSPPVPTSQEEAEALEAEFKKVRCSHCGEPAPHVVRGRYFNRPTQWLRPGVRCQSCLANAPFEYPGVADPSSLLEVMCTHYLRCKSTRKTLGQPWVVIRGEPRPEDVQQGALGNCWFAAALSMVAAKPELVSSLFITKEYNPHGAYQLQLFHAGEWRGILIDDLFPTSKVAVGKLQGEMIHYSRGGNLSYLSCARHQLWVPLVEKAAAKLSGSYGNLTSGTFGEALALFTGFPTERVMLYEPAESRRRRAERRDQKIAERTQMLLRGETPPEDEEEDDDMLPDSFRDDLLWSKLLSFREAGYLMGMGCTEQGCEKTKEAIVEMGLQAPHAYGILDVRECEDANGQVQKLIQIRNPWGEDAPRTWKGDWGKDSPKWTFDMKLKLGVVNRSNIEMYDPMSIFWMSFEDVKQYFVCVEVCRVHGGWEEYRERAWLPSGVGPGEAFDLTVYERTQVDLALWQERHITRESAVGASTNVDVGLVVLRKRTGAESALLPDFEVVEYVPRTLDNCCSKEMILEGGYVYRLAPLCIGLMQREAPRRVTCVVHASNPVTLEKVKSGWRDVAYAAIGASSKGKRAVLAEGVRMGMLHEQAGYIFSIENHTDAPFGVQVDSGDVVGMISSRQGGACGCLDCVPARSRKLVIAIAPRRGAVRTAYSFAIKQLPAEAVAWVGEEEPLLHTVVPLPSTAPISPDPAILQGERPARRRRPLAFRGGHHTPKAATSTLAASLVEEDADAEAEAEALAEAMRLSMQQEGSSPVAAEEDDDLAEAIRMSMETTVPAPAEAPASEPAAATTATTATAGTDFQRLVKELFEEFTKQGLSPNDAAPKAIAEAKARVATGPGAAGLGAPAPPPRMNVAAHACLGAICLLGGLCPAVGTRLTERKERPVMKVVRLLEDMKAELEKEKADDDAVHEKLTCWCEENDKEKTAAIELGRGRMTDLKAALGEYAGKIEELRTSLADTKTQLREDQAALDSARAIRTQEAAAFHNEEKELLDTIAACKQALVVLSKHHPSLFQLQGVAKNLEALKAMQLAKDALGRDKIAVLKAFLEQAQDSSETDSLRRIPGFQSYTPQSGQIFGILKQMQEEFEASLSRAQKEEMKARADFEALQTAKEAELKAGRQKQEQLEQDDAHFREKNAQAYEELQDVGEQVKVDETFLANLKKRCSESADEYEERRKSRLEELAAVSDTIAFLNTDEAFDIFDKTVNTPSTFLQTRAARRVAHDPAGRRQQAAEVLRKSGKPEMALLAQRVQLDAFTDVKAAIDKMVAELTKQQQEEIVHRNWCKDEFAKNERNTAEQNDKKASLENAIADGKKTIDHLTKELEASAAAIAEMQKEMKKASDIREAENADYQEVVADQRITQAILQKALDRMKQVYALAQTEEEPQPGAPHVQLSGTDTEAGNGPARFASYSKNTKGNRVVGMLQRVLVDSQQMEKAADRAEQDAQSAYENFMKDSNKAIEQYNRSIVDMTEDKGKAEKALVMNKADLADTDKELENLQGTFSDLSASCDFLVKNFDARQEARETEIAALKEAKAILSGMQ